MQDTCDEFMMPRRTPQKAQLKNERPLDNLDLDLGLNNSHTTQLLSEGELKKVFQFCY